MNRWTKKQASFRAVTPPPNWPPIGPQLGPQSTKYYGRLVIEVWEPTDSWDGLVYTAETEEEGYKTIAALEEFVFETVKTLYRRLNRERR